MDKAVLSVVDLHRLRWLWGNVLALLAFWTASALDLAHGPVLWVAFSVTALITLLPRWVGVLRVEQRGWIAPLVISIILIDLVMHIRDPLRPLIRTLELLAFLRAISHRRPREDLQLLVVAMFLTVISGVFTLSLLFALQAFFFATLSIGFLFMVNLTAGEPDAGRGAGDWSDFRWGKFFRRLVRACDRRGALLAGMVFVGLACGSAFLFMVIPRVQLDQAIPLFALPGEGQTGFSDRVGFGDVTAITQDNSIALRVDAPAGVQPPAQPYWRMLVLDRYRGGYFENSSQALDAAGKRIVQQHLLTPFPGRYFSGMELLQGDWTFYLEGRISKYLPFLGPFREARFQGRQTLYTLPQLMVFHLPNVPASVFSYRVTDFFIGDFLPGTDLDQPLISWIEAGVPEGETSTYPGTTLGLPVSSEERLYLLGVVEEIAAGDILAPEEFAARASIYLQGRHRYSLEPGPAPRGRDPVVAWLERGGDGHCEYFAGALVLISRAAGIPARMVVGFAGGSWNSFENYFVVRNRNAHAWVEVFDGSRWRRFDPTPGSGLERDGFSGFDQSGGLFGETGLGAWVDSLRILWYRRVINFDEQSQRMLVEDVATRAQQISESLKEGARGAWHWIQESIGLLIDTIRRSPAAFLPLLIGVLVIILLFTLPMGIRWRWWSLRWERAGLLRRNRRLATRLLRKLEKSSKAEQLTEIREQLLEIRYGPDERTLAATDTLRQLRKHLRR